MCAISVVLSTSSFETSLIARIAFFVANGGSKKGPTEKTMQYTPED